MRKLVFLMHISLDGYVAGPNGEMDWILLSDALFEDVHTIASEADSAVYGRVTFEMMEAYWPTAAEQPNATHHDIVHGNWANAVPKYVFSRTRSSAEWQNTHFIADNIVDEMARLKAQPGKNLLLLGSTTTAQTFMRHNLIDEYIFNVNPIMLGAGRSVFPERTTPSNLTLQQSKPYDDGVMQLRYAPAS